MAVFKPVKNPCDTEYALLNLCNYIVRADRTSGHIGGRGLSPNSAYQEILGVHELWGKNNGRLAYHLIVSFDDMEALVPLEAEEIALRVSSLFFPEYQVLYGVHTEQAHLHVHFAVNTVSL